MKQMLLAVFPLFFQEGENQVCPHQETNAAPSTESGYPKFNGAWTETLSPVILIL
jgi:hypothetical protein